MQCNAALFTCWASPTIIPKSGLFEFIGTCGAKITGCISKMGVK